MKTLFDYLDNATFGGTIPTTYYLALCEQREFIYAQDGQKHTVAYAIISKQRGYMTLGSKSTEYFDTEGNILLISGVKLLPFQTRLTKTNLKKQGMKKLIEELEAQKKQRFW